MEYADLNSRLDRRRFLSRSAVAAGAMAVAAPFEALMAHGPQGGPNDRGPNPDYGPRVETIDETTKLPLLLLPEGFRYLSLGWTGDMMSDGIVMPGSHDGMAAFRTREHNLIRLVRNHEVGEGPNSYAAGIDYDPNAAAARRRWSSIRSKGSW